MNFTRLSTAEDGMFEEAMELYSKSFPPHEKRRLEAEIEILSCEEYHFDLIWDENEFVGIILYWETNEFIYIEHLCVNPQLRNQNYGGRTLEMIKELGKIVILEIDPPVDEISIRRKGFYERAGFIVNGYYVHPPYTKGADGNSLVVMTNQRVLTEEEYQKFYQYLKLVVMETL